MEPWQTPFYQYMDRPEAVRVPKGSILAVADLEQITPEWLARWPLVDVRALAIVLGAPSSGTRAKVEATILTHAQLRIRLSRFARPDDLRQMPSRTLGTWLKDVGAYVPSNRYARAQALWGWQARCRLEGRKALARRHHYLHVRRAVRQGLPVPAEVLADYPDLEADPTAHPLFHAEATDASD